jgi:hypothetical protein
MGIDTGSLEWTFKTVNSDNTNSLALIKLNAKK